MELEATMLQCRPRKPLELEVRLQRQPVHRRRLVPERLAHFWPDLLLIYSAE